MSNYTKSTNFATKDNLTPGDPLKIVRGTEIDTEYNNIATAIATKTDNSSAAITGGTINATTIGATTASTGAFSTLSATGAITSTLATGTAPLVIASTTKVANLNVESLDGADWASPAALGSTTPAAVSATTLTTSSTVTFNGGTANGVAYLNGSKVVTSDSALVFDGTKLGIGTSSPTYKLVVSAAGASGIEFGPAYSGTANLIQSYNRSGSAYVDMVYEALVQRFNVSGTEKMRLTSTGLGIGTTTPSQKLEVVGSAQLNDSGTFYLNNSDNTNQYYWQNIGSSGAGNATLILSRTNAGETLRVDSSGNLLVGTTTTGSYFDGKVTSYSANTYPVFAGKQGESAASVMIQWNAGTTGNNIFTYFVTEASPTVRGSISYNRAGGLTAYNTTSDYRAKDIIGTITDSGSVIDSVPVYMGKMKGATQERPMFIAHETPAYAHTGEKDAVDENGNPKYQQMDASALIPVMWAEIQSLRKRLADAGI